MRWIEVHPGKLYRSGEYRLVRWRGYLARIPGGISKRSGWFVQYGPQREIVADVNTLQRAKQAAREHAAKISLPLLSDDSALQMDYAHVR